MRRFAITILPLSGLLFGSVAHANTHAHLTDLEARKLTFDYLTASPGKWQRLTGIRHGHHLHSRGVTIRTVSYRQSRSHQGAASHRRHRHHVKM